MDDFRVLGPLEVRSSNTVMPIPSRRQRAILARLLLEPGATVSADALADTAWGGEDQPRDARAALQTQISRLRAALGPLGGKLLTNPPGYRLDIAAKDVDAHTFERRILEGRDLSGWDPRAALALYDQALALWRGRAYAEFADGFAQPEATRLEQLRVAAAEDRIEALLAIGEAASAVADAESLISSEPLRERPYALVMRALAASGRQGEALAVYQRLRDRLSEELGTEPSEPVRAVHLQILRQEPDQATRQDHGARHTSMPALSRVPAAVSSFVGRQRELEAVSVALTASRMASLVGPGGVGKTRVAIEWAQQHNTAQPVAWVELASLRDPTAVPNAFLDALGVPDPPGESPLDALITALRSRHILLVVDNCEHVIEEAARTVHAITRSCAHVRILTTSRERLALEGEHVITVRPLPVATGNGEVGNSTAVQLFLDRMGAAGHAADADDPEVRRLAETICHRLDGLPLALELTAAHAATLGLASVAGTTDLLDLAAGRRSGQVSHRSLRATLSWSYDLLTRDEQCLLRRLAVFPGWFPIPWATTVCSDTELPPDYIPMLIASLVDKSLVIRRSLPAGGDRGLALLETVKHFADERLVAAGEADRFRTDHARFVVEWAENAAGSIGTAEETELAEIAAAASDLRAAKSWTHQNDTDLALRLSAALHRYAELRADNEIKGWAETASLLPGAETHPLRPVVLASAASGAVSRGGLEHAVELIEKALESMGPDYASAGYPLSVFGTVCVLSGEPRKSARALRRGWQAARQAQDRFTEAETAGHLAALLSYLGNQAGSERWLTRCRTAARAPSGASTQALVEMVTGESKISFDPDEALVHLNRCYEMASSLGANLLTGTALTGLVTVRSRLSRSQASVAAYLQALKHWQTMGDQIHLWITLRNLIPVLTHNSQDEAALALHAAVSTSPAALRIHGTESEALDQAVEESRIRVGDGASDIQVRWRGATTASAVDVASRAINAILEDSTVATAERPEQRER
ncbi:BTAD domain-containing putative transcriptional regulator [Streptomyces sp. NPDC099088]|uniref:AfsR/SARP family transcriptional regulator n=1 Tax=Streptomyces sp. NPDC099088 TaxID=3366101 RepID=UPI00380F6CA3